MTAPRDTDRLINAFLDEGRDELPDRTYDVVRARIERTRQRVVVGPWREEQMLKYAGLGLAAAAAVLVAVVGLRSLVPTGTVGGPPASTPTAAPTAAPTAIVDPRIGRLDAGTYVGHPFGVTTRELAFTATVPSNSWEAHGRPGEMFGFAWHGAAEGVGVGFLDVLSLNGDPCKWSGWADDVPMGTSVDDLVTALRAQSAYTTSTPADVTLGRYSGKKVVVTMPTEPFPLGDSAAPDCDEGVYRIWNARGFDIYVQGPAQIWTMYILDIEGKRVVVLRGEFADSDAERIEELDAIVESIEITVATP